jgi:MFS family permease
MASPAVDRTASGFLLVGGLGVAGTMVGLLGTTSASTYAASGSGGLTTGVFLSLMLAAAAIATVNTSRLTLRWGRRRVFAWAQMGVCVAWSIVGVIETLTDSSLVVLYVAAPILGALSGITGVLTPFVTRAYLDPESMSISLARRGVVSGLAAILGASLGGVLIHMTDPGVGILANGLLTIPLAVFVSRCSPRSTQEPAQRKGDSARDLWAAVRMNPQLRTLTVLTVASAILVVPLFNLLVPILNDLDHDPLPSGAGFMLAGTAAGRILVPGIMKRLLRRTTEFPAALWALASASAFMMAFAVSTVFLEPAIDLVLWTLLGIGLGASRFTYRLLVISAGARSDRSGDEIIGVAALVVTASVMAPLGTLLWGVALDWVGASITIAAAAIATAGAAAIFAARTRTARTT